MKLATLKDGSRDTLLAMVSGNLFRQLWSKRQCPASRRCSNSWPMASLRNPRSRRSVRA